MRKSSQSTIGALPNLDAFVSQAAQPPAAASEAPAPTHTTARPAEATVVMTTRIPASIHQRLKVHCAMTQQSLQDFALRALETQLTAEQTNR